MKLRLLRAACAAACTPTVLPLALAALALPCCQMQAEKPGANAAADAPTTGAQYQTFFLSGSARKNDALDIVNDLRNMIGHAKVYYAASQNAISVQGTPDEIETARKILGELDKPRKTYRLTYTITNLEDGKRTGAQHYTLLVSSDGETEFKQGSKVPIVTGSSESAPPVVNSQVQYLDVGMKIQASVEGTTLRTKIEQSHLAEEKSGLGAQDPIVKQVYLDGISSVMQGKPVVLGSLDFPDSTRREEIEVVAESVQ